MIGGGRRLAPRLDGGSHHAPASAKAISSASAPSAVIARAVARASARTGGRAMAVERGARGAGVMRELLEQVGRVLEGKAAIALAVGVRAFERPPGLTSSRRRATAAARRGRCDSGRCPRAPGRSTPRTNAPRTARRAARRCRPCRRCPSPRPSQPRAGDRAGTAEPRFLRQRRRQRIGRGDRGPRAHHHTL
jgi:hypothetical protein